MHAKSKRDSLSCMKMKIRESTRILYLSLNNFLGPMAHVANDVLTMDIRSCIVDVVASKLDRNLQ